jgi:hypothetical protein
LAIRWLWALASRVLLAASVAMAGLFCFAFFIVLFLFVAPAREVENFGAT